MTSKKKRKSSSLDSITYGDEPIWTTKHLNGDSIASFLNWYSYTKDATHAQKYLIDYLKVNFLNNKKLITFVQNQNEKDLKRTYCWIARISIKAEEVLPKKYTNKLLSYIEQLEEQLNQNKKDKEKKKVVKTESKKTQIKKNHLIIIDSLDNRLDDFIVTKKLSKLNIIEFLKEFPHSESELAIVFDFINDQVEYWKQVLLDEELLEAHNFLTKKQINSLVELNTDYLVSIKDFIHTIKNTQSVKKPRKKKTIRPEQQVKKLKYKLECSDLNIKSIDAASIIGKKCLLVFNTKTRILSIYHSDTGFAVKGSTLLNWNTERSFGKILRNPDKEIDKYLIINQKVLETKIDTIKASKKKLTGRINSDTILVKVF